MKFSLKTWLLVPVVVAIASIFYTLVPPPPERYLIVAQCEFGTRLKKSVMFEPAARVEDRFSYDHSDITNFHHSLTDFESRLGGRVRNYPDVVCVVSTEEVIYATWASKSNRNEKVETIESIVENLGYGNEDLEYYGASLSTVDTIEERYATLWEYDRPGAATPNPNSTQPPKSKPILIELAINLTVTFTRLIHNFLIH